jgi:hypothetical protein
MKRSRTEYTNVTASLHNPFRHVSVDFQDSGPSLITNAEGFQVLKLDTFSEAEKQVTSTSHYINNFFKVFFKYSRFNFIICHFGFLLCYLNSFENCDITVS